MLRHRAAMPSVTLLGLLAWSAAALGQSQPTPSAPPDLSQPHPFGVHDMVRMQRVGEPVPSPDGQSDRLYRPRRGIADANKSTTNLWLIATTAQTLRQLTGGKASSPTRRPPGRPTATPWHLSPTALARGRFGRSRWTAAKRRQLTKFPVDVDNLRWSPDGLAIRLHRGGLSRRRHGSDRQARQGQGRQSGQRP